MQRAILLLLLIGSSAFAQNEYLEERVLKLEAFRNEAEQLHHEQSRKIQVTHRKANRAIVLSSDFDRRLARLETYLRSCGDRCDVSEVSYGPEKRWFCGIAHEQMSKVGRGFGRTRLEARSRAVQNCLNANRSVRFSLDYCNQEATTTCDEINYDDFNDSQIDYGKIYYCAVSHAHLEFVGTGYGSTEAQALTNSLESCIQLNSSVQSSQASCISDARRECTKTIERIK